MTRKKKYEAYVQCLKDIESNKYKACCYSFANNGFMDSYEMSPKNIFTELYKLKTTYNDVYWFKNKQERIDALKKCIELTKD